MRGIMKYRESHRYIGVGLAVVLFVFGLSVIARPQNVQYQQYSVDYANKLDLKVDPITLGMSFNLPLTTYSGRGKTSIPFELSYNSKVWKMQYEGYYMEGTCCQPLGFPPFQHGMLTDNFYSWVSVQFAENTVSGWQLRGGFPSFTNDWLSLYDSLGDPAGIENYYQNFIVDSFRLQMPNGSTVEFRKDDKVHILPYQPSYPETYFSTDGSRMKFVRDDAYSGTLFLPDGSKYIVGGNRAFFDVAGNKVSSVDTLGRPVNSNNLSNADGDQVLEFPGFGNEAMSYILKWRYLRHPQTQATILSNPNDDLHYLGDSIPTGQYSQVSPSLFGSAAGTRVTPDSLFNPLLLSELELPDGRAYRFRYNVYGEIDTIIYPTGAYERFEYDTITGISPMNDPYTQANRGVVKRWVSENGTGNDELLWQYSAGNTNGYWTRVTNPDGTYTVRIIKQGLAPGYLKYGFDDATAGSILEERFYTASDSMIRRTLNSYTMEGPRGSGAHQNATRDPRLEKSISITIEPNSSTALMTMTENEFDWHSDLEYFAYLNVKRVKEHGYVTVSKAAAEYVLNNFGTFSAYFNPQTLVRITEYDYLYDGQYKSRYIHGLVTETRIKDENGNVKAKTQYFYDQSGHTLSSSGTMPTAAAGSWVDPNTSILGNLTSVKSYYDIANGYFVETKNYYDQFGNLRKTRDGRGHDTVTEYDDDYAFAYPTKVTTPVPDPYGVHGSNTAFESFITYDYNTGLPLTSTDANGQTSTMEYNDPLLRPTRVIAPNGHQTITEYGQPDTNGQLPASQRFVKARSQIDATSWNEGVSWFDGLGRTVKTQSVNAETGDIFTLSCYDNMSRVSKSSNPFRGFTGQSCATANGSSDIFWTSNTFDAAGRLWRVTTPDNAVVETDYDLATSGGQIGTVVTVTDQAGKQRRSITNSLGQLIRVDEPNDAGQLGAVSSPNQPTFYTYDTLNNLTTVTQGVQTRTFTYNSLSRLLTAANPESGTISYGYDSIGNLTTKTDARSITTTYAYDALNRVTQRSYSDSTPAVSYFYDNLTNAKGKLTKVTSSVSTTEYTSFDILGRVTGHKQTTDGTAYLTGYAYNLSGAMVEQVYPSGRVVKNVLDNYGYLSMVQSKKNADAGFWNYAENFTYNPAGAVTSMQLGNVKWESTQFSSRLQPTQIGLGSTMGATNLLKLDYEYGATASVNNGNITKQTITVPTVGVNTGFTAVQDYTYDSLNRLKSAVENVTPHGGSPTQSWKQAYTFDRYGNRRFDLANGNTTFPDPNCPEAICNPTISTSNNRLTSTGWSYDSAGNTTNDPQGRVFTYDGENKQYEVRNSANQIIGQYFFDGNGKRVKKVVPATGEVTVFVYDAMDKLVAEYSTQVESVENAKIAYLTSDHLGSPRIKTDRDGAVISRNDYLPYGEDLYTAQRTQNLGYSSDDIRQKFTGYERDDEIDLDFAQARYYNKNHGRFTSTDEPFLDQFESDAQSWNLYVYVRNNPLCFTDPTGMWKWSDPDQNGYRFVVWEKNDNWQSLAEFLYQQTGNYYPAATLEDFYGQTGMAPLGEGLVLYLGHFDGRPLPGPHGIQDATVENLPINRAGGVIAKTGIIAWLLRKIGIGGAKQQAKKEITKEVSKKTVADVSKRNLKHIKNRHLDEFKAIDPSITLERVVEIGQKIVTDGVATATRASNRTFQGVVEIGGRPTTVKVVLNSQGGIRSIYPLK
ncbi:MAG: RHS repeat-associated core domain-containing protein [Acidobacteriota bacterium]|nr:MAG: RHS repeat-associated core domain-containing protein [Acidobacteriota bacterium]